MMRRGVPSSHWKNHLRAWLEGRCRDVPFGWLTSRGEPRCVRCTIPLDEFEAARKLAHRVRGCDECIEHVRIEVEEILGSKAVAS